MDALTGGGQRKAQRAQQEQLRAQQRQQLADIARQQAEVDQASSAPAGRKSGRGLLTFLDGAGQDTFG